MTRDLQDYDQRHVNASRCEKEKVRSSVTTDVFVIEIMKCSVSMNLPSSLL